MPMGRGDWSMEWLASLAPMYPTYDLLINDPGVVDDGMMMPPLGGNGEVDVPPATMTGCDGDDGLLPWQFGGGFGEDTVWQFLNQYEPGTSG